MVKIRDRLKNFLSDVGNVVFSLEKPCTSGCPGYVCPDCGYRNPCTQYQINNGLCYKYERDCICICPRNCAEYVDCNDLDFDTTCYRCDPYCGSITFKAIWVGTPPNCRPKTCEENGYYSGTNCNGVCPTPTPTPPPTYSPAPTPTPTPCIPECLGGGCGLPDGCGGFCPCPAGFYCENYTCLPNPTPTPTGYMKMFNNHADMLKKYGVAAK